MDCQITLADLIAGYRSLGAGSDASADARLNFWIETLGGRLVTSLTCDDIEDAVCMLAKRGKMKTVRGRAIPTGKPLAESSIARYLGTLEVVFKWGRKQRYLPRSWMPPTRNLDKTAAPVDKNKFLTPEQVEMLVCRFASKTDPGFALNIDPP